MVQRPPAGTIPEAPGSYQFKDAHGRVIYVGKAKNLRQRLSNYFQNPRNLPPRTAQMVATAESVEWIQVRNDVEALMLEYSLIKQHQPRFNIRLRDDKSYPFLAVTLDDEWPRAMVMRGTQAQGHPLLRALRPRLRHPRDPRPAAAHLPDPHLLRQQARPPRAAGAALPAVPHREVLRPVRGRDRQGGLRPARRRAGRLPRRRHRHRRAAPRGRDAGGERRARVRAGGPSPRPARRGPQGHREAADGRREVRGPRRHRDRRRRPRGRGAGLLRAPRPGRRPQGLRARQGRGPHRGRAGRPRPRGPLRRSAADGRAQAGAGARSTRPTPSSTRSGSRTSGARRSPSACPSGATSASSWRRSPATPPRSSPATACAGRPTTTPGPRPSTSCRTTSGCPRPPCASSATT